MASENNGCHDSFGGGEKYIKLILTYTAEGSIIIQPGGGMREPVRAAQIKNTICERMTIMKKLIAVILMLVALLSLMAVPASAIKMADSPIPGPDAPTKWGAVEIMSTGYEGASSPWSDAFCNDAWTGCTWVAAKIGDVQAVTISPNMEKSAYFMDYNYYQWNNDKYYPSLVCGNYPVIAYRVMYNQPAADAMNAAKKLTFWASSDSPKLGATRSTGTLDVADANTYKADTWYTVTIDLSKFTFSDGAAWANETIRQYRLYPFGTAKLTADCRAHLEWVGFFADLNEAKDYKGPYYVEPVETTAAAEAAKPAAAAPQTFDAITLTAAAAVVSLGSALVLRRKSSR